MLVHPHTEIIDPDFCAEVRRRSPIRTWGWSGAPGATASTASPGGRARSCAAPASTATRSTAAARCPRSRWTAARPAARRGRGAGRLAARPLAVGGAHSASTRRCCSVTASTSTSACRCARPAKADGRRPAGRAPPLAGARRRPRPLGRGAHPDRREVERPSATTADGGRGRLEAAGAPGRGASARRHGPSPTPTRSSSTRGCWSSSASWPRRPGAAPGGSPRRCGGSTSRRAGQRRRRLMPPERPSSSSARRISSLETTDWSVAMPARIAQPREALGDRERAGVQQPPQHRLLARQALLAATARSRARAPRARWCTRLASRRSSIGLRSHGSRIRATRVGPGRGACARPRRSRRTPARRPAAALAVGDEVLDRGEHAVARAALLGRRPRVGQAAGRAAGSPGNDALPAAGDRVAVRRPGSARRRSSRRGGRGASRRRGTAAAAARRSGARSPISRSSSLTV